MAEKMNSMPAADKKRAIETAMQQIEKLYGKGSIMRYGDAEAANVEAVSTGSLALDLALGIGGLPKGRIIEIYGPESSGKTTLALHVLAQAQRAGGEDGLDFYRAITDLWRDALVPGGLLAFEVGIGQADEVLRIMRAKGFGDLEIIKDLHFIPRVVYGRLCSEI